MTTIPKRPNPVIESDKEDILVVPKQWTKKGYQLLVQAVAVPRPWHLEGRWGSRTHTVDANHMGLPIVSVSHLKEVTETSSALQELLRVEGVEVRENQPFCTSKRAKEGEVFDATIHAERHIRPSKRPRIQLTPSSSQVQLTAQVFPPSTDSQISYGNSFTYAELFCGIGGFGVALEALGGRCLMVSEIDETCRQVYEANFPLTPRDKIYGDIYQVQESNLPPPGTLDLLVGGFPCQPFSNLSEQPGFQCPKGRGLLFEEIVRVLRISQPKAFLLENVPGLRDMKESFDHIVMALEGVGYQVVCEVCNARGMTATKRKRLFFTGHRKDLESSSVFRFPFVPDLKLRAQDILDYDELPSKELELLRLSDETFSQLSKAKRWRPHHLAWPNKSCDTMTSHYGNAVGRGESQLVPSHAPYNPRRFTARECGRLMGFPNSFQLIAQSENQGDMAYQKQFYRMFGNAVCPPLIAVLAGAVLEHGQVLEGGIEKGLATGVTLAMAATRDTVVAQPMGCLVLDETLV